MHELVIPLLTFLAVVAIGSAFISARALASLASSSTAKQIRICPVRRRLPSPAECGW